MVEKSVLLEKVCGKIYIREVYKSEFTGSVTRKPKRYTGKKRLRKE